MYNDIHSFPSFHLGCQLKTAAAVDCSWPLDSTLDVCVVVLQLQVTGTRTSTFTAMPRLHNPPIKGRNLIVIHSTVLCKYRRLPPSFLPSFTSRLSFFLSFFLTTSKGCQSSWLVGHTMSCRHFTMRRKTKLKEFKNGKRWRCHFRGWPDVLAVRTCRDDDTLITNRLTTKWKRTI